MKNIEQAGFVYILHAEGTNRFKIGYSTNPKNRCQDISQQSPFPISLIHSYPSDEAYRDEQKLHNMFSNRRIHGEWFYFDSVEHIKVLINEFFEIKSVTQTTKPFPVPKSSLPKNENNTRLQHPETPELTKTEYPNLSNEQVRIISDKQKSSENNSNPNDTNRRKLEAIASYCQRKGETSVRKIQQGKLLSDDYKLDSNFIKYALDTLSGQGLISLDKSSEDWIVESLTGSSVSPDKSMQILAFCDGKKSVSVRDVRRSLVGYNLSSDVVKHAFNWLENNGFGTVTTENGRGGTRVLFSPCHDIKKPENNSNPDDKFMQILAFCEGRGSASVRDVQRVSVGRDLSSDVIKYAFEWLENNGFGTAIKKQIGGSARVTFTPTPNTDTQLLKDC